MGINHDKQKWDNGIFMMDNGIFMMDFLNNEWDNGIMINPH